MTPLVKVGVIGGALTSLAGAGYASTYLFSYPTEKISDLIEKEYTYILLRTGSNEDTTHWQSAWGAYKTANNSKENDVFGLTGWKKDGSVDVTNKLKEKCNELKDSFVYGSSDTLYKNVTSYCGRLVTVEDQARKKGLSILDTSGDTSSGDWDKKNTGKQSLKAHIETLGMTFASVDANGIKSGCATAKSKQKIKTQNYDSVYVAYEAVCTKPRGG